MRPPDASVQVSTETVAGDSADDAVRLPNVTPDLFLAAGVILADLATRSLASPADVEDVLRRAVQQAIVLRTQSRESRTVSVG